MSYCRFGDNSDVYLYPDVSGKFHCVFCNLEEGSVWLDTLEEVLTHLKVHRASGDRVPDYAFERVREELGCGELGNSSVG